MKKVLYIAPLLPSTSGNGGRRACYNHILELDDKNLHIDAVLIDVENSHEKLPVFPRNFEFHVFSRSIPKFELNLKSIFIAAKELLSNILPRALRVVCSYDAINFIIDRNKKNNYDVVIVDHLNAYGILRLANLYCKVVYIAHNAEYSVAQSQISNLSVFNILRVIRYFDSIKTKIIELELCRVASKIILISNADASIYPINKFREKIITWPELPAAKKKTWNIVKNKKILFVGSAKYFPNRDAIEWLVETALPFMRSFDPEITLQIAGTAKHELSSRFHFDYVNYLGFVSDDKLKELHLDSILFICPVILGGGIKIKLLEAASYGTPIAANFESLNGIDYIREILTNFDRNNIYSLKNVVDLINDGNRLSKMSSDILKALAVERENRAALKSLI